jgi:hypothetical protein
MGLDLDKLFITEEGFGLFLGAGASFCAGYPLMSDLTTEVLSSLTRVDFEIIDKVVFESLGVHIDVNSGYPNIELISDALELRIVDAPSKLNNTLVEIAERIRDKILNAINSITKPDLDYHVILFDALRKIFSGRCCAIWIFTTNYDLVIEYAAAIAGISVFDGFQGSALRYLNINSYLWKHGTYYFSGKSNIFQPCKLPYINLVKLHGSVNWWTDKTKVYSSGEHLKFSNDLKRTMILPRKKKVREVLESPYDSIWRVASNAIGSECKFITSIGYSYGDQHINETLLLPKVQENKICLNALLRNESEQIKDFCKFSSFKHFTEQSGYNLWDFKEFVNHVVRISG